MESFLSGFRHESISFYLQANGIDDGNFYTDQSKIQSLLKDYPRFEEFMRDYNTQRSSMHNINEQRIIHDPSTSEQSLNSESLNKVSNIKNSGILDDTVGLDSESPVECHGKRNIPREEYDKYFKNNDLFFLLNGTLEGQIIFGRYLNTKYIDISSLKRIIILHEYKEGSDELKLQNDDFVRLSEQLRELFPELDKDSLYIPYTKNEDTEESVGQRGSLYQEYKVIRKHLRESGICVPYKPSQKTINKQRKQELDSQYSILNDPEQDNYEFSEIVGPWEETWLLRSNQLAPANKLGIKPISLNDYFRSFPCLRPPIAAVELLKSDFKQVVKNLPDNKKLSPNDPKFYLDTFSKNWPNEAKKIVEFVKKSTKPALKVLFKDNATLFSTDSLSSTAALIALVSCINVPKPVSAPKQSENDENIDNVVKHIADDYQIGGKRSRSSDTTDDASTNVKKNFSKHRISQSFILNIKDFSNLNVEKEEFESVIDDNNLEHHPYVIACGDWSNLTHTYLVLNKQLYRCETLVEGVEKCFQCLMALRRWPYLCDHIWYFIMKRIYSIKPPKSYHVINALCTQLNRFK